MVNNNFNIRVYGLIVNDNLEVVLSKEKYGNEEFIKFPGGGLEYGEGLIDCLKRECLEETNMEVEVGDHFYTTDFFQSSIMDNSQVISIYYWLKPKTKQDFPIQSDNGIWEFYAINSYLENTLSLPIDKVVAAKLYQYFYPFKK